MPIKRYSVTIPIEFDLPGKTMITTEVGYACYAETSEQAVEATKLFLADESEKIIDAISEGVFDGIRAFADEVPLIPSLIDQNPRAHFLSPMDMILQG